MLDVVGGSTREVLNVGALAVEIGEYYDLLLVVLAQILGDDHVVVRIRVVQLNYIVVSTKVVGYFALEGGAGETSPKYFFALYHGFVWFADTPVKIQVSTLLGISLELPGKLFLVILLELLLDDSDDC